MALRGRPPSDRSLNGPEGQLSDLERWLEPRLSGVPASLRERILAAVSSERCAGGDEDGRGLPAHRLSLTSRLREAAEVLLAEAKSAPASRDSALTLLAADALMTFACEATAQLAPEQLEDLR